MVTMWRGQFKIYDQPDKVLRGCRNKERVGEVPIYDVDIGKTDYVTVETGECSRNNSRYLRKSRKNVKSHTDDIIDIDDEDCNSSSEGGAFGDTVHSTSISSSSYSHICDEDDDEECVLFVKEEKAAQGDPSNNGNSSACAKGTPKLDGICNDGLYVGQNYGLSSSGDRASVHDIVEPVSYESESSDCEIVDDPTGNIQEVWRKAASKKKMQNGFHKSSEMQADVSESGSESTSGFYEKCQGKVDIQEDARKHCFCGRKFEGVCHCNANENINQDAFHNSNEFTDETFSHYNEAMSFEATENLNPEMHPVADGANCCNQEGNPPFSRSDTTVLGRKKRSGRGKDLESMNSTQKESLKTNNGTFSESGIFQLSSEDVDANSHGKSILGDRERHKESDEYMRATKEEWAARQEQLRKQSEEIQRLRRRKKMEILRLLDMKRRQKQRLEEVRKSQKQNEETMNLKEQFRMEVRKKLERMELQHKDMASLLRGLGIQFGGGPFPSPHEVNAAYRKALLKFHPDRASKTDVRQQVEAEETFKLISRLKEKLLPVI